MSEFGHCDIQKSKVMEYDIPRRVVVHEFSGGFCCYFHDEWFYDKWKLCKINIVCLVNLISFIYSDLYINSEEICNIFNHIIIQKDNMDAPFRSVLAPQGER